MQCRTVSRELHLQNSLLASQSLSTMDFGLAGGHHRGGAAGAGSRAGPQCPGCRRHDWPRRLEAALGLLLGCRPGRLPSRQQRSYQSATGGQLNTSRVYVCRHAERLALNAAAGPIRRDAVVINPEAHLCAGITRLYSICRCAAGAVAHASRRQPSAWRPRTDGAAAAAVLWREGTWRGLPLAMHRCSHEHMIVRMYWSAMFPC